MVTALFVALSLAVPYLPQTEALCGGAAAAMVLRYWGDIHASIDQFGPLVDRRAGGIADDVLVEALAARGWSATTFPGSTDRLRKEIEQEHPVIILVASGRARYHYVVVTGVDTSKGIVVHDPTWGPARMLSSDELERIWRPTAYWSLVILPTDRVRDADAAQRTRPPADAGPIPGSLGEQAGILFGERQWARAAEVARQATAQDPSDRYAWDVLGSSRFMLDDQVAALGAWNHLARPRIDSVEVEGLRRTRFRIVSDALDLQPNALLTVESFRLADRRLQALPDRSASRLSYKPLSQGYATVQAAVVERSWGPKGVAEWTAKGLGAAFEREVGLNLPGPGGQGGLLSGKWRWWRNRPAVTLSFAAPRTGKLGGVWQVDGGWDRQAYAFGANQPFSQIHEHVGLSWQQWMTSNLLFSITGGFDSWENPVDVRASFLGGTLERRWRDDRWSLSGQWTTWIAGGDTPNFNRSGLRVAYQSSREASGWVYTASGGAQHVTSHAPFGLWPGAGEGHASDLLLRAHPLLDEGVVRFQKDVIFARTVAYATTRAERWLPVPGPVKIAAAGFADLAGATAGMNPVDTLTAGRNARLQLDLGTGLRLRIPGAGGTLRIDYAHGVRDGANAVTAGWDF